MWLAMTAASIYDKGIDEVCTAFYVRAKIGRAAAIALCASALAVAGCAPTGKVGETSTFDVSQASTDDIASALDRDGRVVLRGVLFETDSARLSPTGADNVAKLADVLQRNPAMKLAVVGYTDNTGDFRYKLDLSKRRAEAMTGSLIRDHGGRGEPACAARRRPVEPCGVERHA